MRTPATSRTPSQHEHATAVGRSCLRVSILGMPRKRGTNETFPKRERIGNSGVLSGPLTPTLMVSITMLVAVAITDGKSGKTIEKNTVLTPAAENRWGVFVT